MGQGQSVKISVNFWNEKFKSIVFCMTLIQMKQVESVSYKSRKFYCKTLRHMKWDRERSFYILS